ncbi:MAG: hypothetical protein KBT15_08405 [Bacteroidales bacterium]|nr:hypothetical protein [Candidatus Minthousia equi]
MALNVVHQREIVEVPFDMPDGRVLTHMVLVLSRVELQEYEDGMFYGVLISSKNHIPELTIPIKSGWLNKPLSKQSYFITHLIQQFNANEVMHRYNLFLKNAYFEPLVNKILENVVWGNDEID